MLDENSSSQKAVLIEQLRNIDSCCVNFVVLNSLNLFQFTRDACYSGELRLHDYQTRLQVSRVSSA